MSSPDASPSAPALASVATRLAQELSVSQRQIDATIALLDDGATVPFIARYRKEVTGGLDDAVLRTLDERLHYLRDLDERRSAVTAVIDEQGKLTDQIRLALAGAETKSRVEDIYLPFKQKRRTRAQMAKEAGLEPLADLLLADPTLDPQVAAGNYVTDQVADTGAALDGARFILIERAAEDADLVGWVRETFFAEGSISCSPRSEPAAATPAGQKFRDYFEHSEALSTMPSHRVLAMLRGEKEDVLSLKFAGGEDNRYVAAVANCLGINLTNGGAAQNWLATTARWAWRVKLAAMAESEARQRLRERAEDDAVTVFARNLKDLLLAAPAGAAATLGLDPGFRTGVKVAVVDPTGKVLDTCAIYPHQPQKKWDESRATLAALIARHNIMLVAIGNGTASRETDALASDVISGIRSAGATPPAKVVVSEAGASVYSASQYASEELPDLDVSLRGAVSIARRLQDPLAELVKIDPKSIGVGQYQHDVNPVNLARSLNAVVEDAVNAVGVDVNTASVPLLARVSGITQALASAIVAHRDANGPFTTRQALTGVNRLGPKAFELCAGFLRINGGDDPLDASGVHPESYPVVRAIISSVGTPLAQLIGNTTTLQSLRPDDFADERFGTPTVRDIIAELDKPGRDPRPEFTTASFAVGVEKVADLSPGMVLEGVVTNVAAFGAFVDIGVHHDGLVHVSAMSEKFISDPHDVVHSGKVVRVKVVDVDVERQRIGLTLRLNDEPGRKRTASKSGKRRTSDTSSEHDSERVARSKSPHNRGRTTRQAPSSGAMADALRKAGFDRT